MKRICVGDLHGDINLYHKIKSKFPGYMITLVGDLVDSYLYSRTEQASLLELVLNDIEAGTTECIFGNHEWSYLWPEVMKCSGYSNAFAGLITPLKSRMFKNMKYFIYDDSYPEPILFTHAGLTLPLLNKMAPEGEFDIVDVLEADVRKREYGHAFDIGRSRGGPDSVGGIFWCDARADFVPIPGLRQIFGHTDIAELDEVASGNYNIDCLQHDDPEVLKIEEDGTIERVSMKL